MRFQVEGVYQGKPIPPKVIEGSSAEAVRRAAEARGLRDVIVFPADDPFGQEAPQSQPPPPSVEQKPKKRDVAVVIAVLGGILALWLY